ncbi:hypothetical protein ASD77_05895 [Pseudoxanthomonas sp. Root65]|uniref:hypothetical protein n=1 Tax=Pseudoxanthomonas sp. Root65 TaxID=1736576 RepID=UPI0006F6638B|nr:hypothetical protein [Pseudoxanthomonas sp. Root65]KRA54156.1 hypothetical protein ASD77_05895 [Pseudoxanthomonas sp. Root65]
MSDLIAAASTAIQLVGRLREINKNVENAEFSNALADLAIELSELKIKVAGLLGENDQLRRQLAQRQAIALEFKDFAYYSESGDGPFCPGCYDGATKTIRLTKLTEGFTVFGSHSCPACKETFGEA